MKKGVAQRGKTRFTMWIDSEMLTQIQKLQSVTAKGSVADLIREAVSVYASLMTAAFRFSTSFG